MTSKPTYNELERKIKQLEKEVLEYLTKAKAGFVPSSEAAQLKDNFPAKSPIFAAFLKKNSLPIFVPSRRSINTTSRILSMVIYDHWPYMTMLFHVFIRLRAVSFI